MASARVLIFAKRAEPGRVKTRLVPPLSQEQAAEFHLACLDDVMELAATVCGASLTLCAAGGERALADYRQRYPEVAIIPQTEGDLGRRLAGAFEREFDSAAERVVIIGSDHPSLPPEHVTSALETLDFSDVVFGPSSDGGYYLVGMRRGAWPRGRELFHEIPWSTADVLDQSLERSLAARLTLTLLPHWYDVDRPADLPRLLADAPRSRAARLLVSCDILKK